MKFAAALSFAGLALASPLAKRADFQGTGQIITYTASSSANVGCLTAAGQWTVDNSQCGTFTGTLLADGVSLNISSTAGICGTDYLNGQGGQTFNCGQGSYTKYSVINLGYGNRIFFGDVRATYETPSHVAPTGAAAVNIELIHDASGPEVTLGWQA